MYEYRIMHGVLKLRKPCADTLRISRSFVRKWILNSGRFWNLFCYFPINIWLLKITLQKRNLKFATKLQVSMKSRGMAKLQFLAKPAVFTQSKDMTSGSTYLHNNNKAKRKAYNLQPLKSVTKECWSHEDNRSKYLSGLSSWYIICSWVSCKMFRSVYTVVIHQRSLIFFISVYGNSCHSFFV